MQFYIKLMILILSLNMQNNKFMYDEYTDEMLLHPDSTESFLELWRYDSLGCMQLRTYSMFHNFYRNLNLFEMDIHTFDSLFGTPNIVESGYFNMGKKKGNESDIYEFLTKYSYYFHSFCVKGIPQRKPSTSVVITFDSTGKVIHIMPCADG